MIDPWEVLRRGGLPLGAPQRGTTPRAEELAAAVQSAIATEPRGRSRDALAAFILAWRRQWPHTFARVFGADAASTIEWGRASVTDPNRYLKLSRIAVAHLSEVL